MATTYEVDELMAMSVFLMRSNSGNPTTLILPFITLEFRWGYADLGLNPASFRTSACLGMDAFLSR